MKITSGFPGMYRESRHLDRKNSRFCVRSAQNRLFFRRKRVLGETKKHPPRIARVVRLVSLRRLSNFFDSLKASRTTGRLSLSKKVTGRWPFFLLEILELRERMRYNSEG